MGQNTKSEYPKQLSIEPIENGFIVHEQPDHSMGMSGKRWVFTNAHELGQFMERYYGRCVVTTGVDGIPRADIEKTVEWPEHWHMEGNPAKDWYREHFIGNHDAAKHYIAVDLGKEDAAIMPMGGYKVVPKEKSEIQGHEATDMWVDEAKDISDHALDAAALVVHKFKGAK